MTSFLVIAKKIFTFWVALRRNGIPRSRSFGIVILTERGTPTSIAGHTPPVGRRCGDRETRLSNSVRRLPNTLNVEVLL